MKLNSFQELFLLLLSDIYVFENHIISALPKLINKANSSELREVLETHLNETRNHVAKLDRVYHILNEQPREMPWAMAWKTAFAQVESVFLEDNSPSPLLDSAIIVAAQRMKHFEIATYGTLKEFADVLEQDEIKDIVEELLKEEKEADSKLNKIAKGGLFSAGINLEAIRAS